jgi:hypothetical protein
MTPVWSYFVSGGAALLGAGIGAFIPFYRDKRLWKRESEKYWLDTRLATYKELLSAHRQYLAYVMLPDTLIEALPHPRFPGELMPFFDEKGRPVVERHDAAFSALRLVAMSQPTEQAMANLVTSARQVACARAEMQPKQLGSGLFEKTSSYEQAFINEARRELGLPELERGYGIGWWSNDDLAELAAPAAAIGPATPS